ncbi:hypothetical protein C8R44DRAFT_741796 [Mycena epipterygia]|nr:hypothetical protein C8R44DRAFT_741796 [Mycena epipterygia]
MFQGHIARESHLDGPSGLVGGRLENPKNRSSSRYPWRIPWGMPRHSRFRTNNELASSASMVMEAADIQYSRIRDSVEGCLAVPEKYLRLGFATFITGNQIGDTQRHAPLKLTFPIPSETHRIPERCSRESRDSKMSEMHLVLPRKPTVSRVASGGVQEVLEFLLRVYARMRADLRRTLYMTHLIQPGKWKANINRPELEEAAGKDLHCAEGRVRPQHCVRLNTRRKQSVRGRLQVYKCVAMPQGKLRNESFAKEECKADDGECNEWRKDGCREGVLFVSGQYHGGAETID